ncbi:MAG: N-acetylmuramoyl-L-alanine amidase [Myxococcales bacterium]|nr:N-acetylmuramoyl-L-alanine amidase [Myxococcales bacterium]
MVRALVVLVGLLAVAGCAETSSAPDVAPVVSGRGALHAELVAAAEEFAVPVEVLAAAAWSESRLRHRDSAVGRRGLFQLDAAALARGAALVGVSPEEAATDRAQHARVFAALVASGGPELGDALAATRGDAAGGQAFVDGVQAALADGFDADVPGSGHLTLAPGRLGVLRQASRPDTDLARWVASPNYTNASRQRGQVDAVIIHVTQGSYAGAISWFQNPESQVSSQYVIRSRDGEITQMVEEEDIAWHARSWNSHSIGIEHEGFIAEPQWFTEEMYRSSAALTREICERWGIPMDRQHILGHVELSGNDHTDPGPHWDWDHYMDLVRGEDTPRPPCAVVPAGGGTLDDTGPCFVGYGPDQYWRTVEGEGVGGSLRWTNAFRSGDPSNWGRWQLFLETDGEYEVEVSTGGAWGVCTTTPYRIKHAGQTETLSLDQSGPGEWKSLGRFRFSAGGDQYVDVLDNLPGEVAADQHIVADAVRLTAVGSPVVADAGVAEPDAEVPVADAGVDARVDEPTPDAGRPRDRGVAPEPEDDVDAGEDGDDAGTGPRALTGSGDSGCAIDGRPGSPAWLWLLGLVALRRRKPSRPPRR